MFEDDPSLNTTIQMLAEFEFGGSDGEDSFALKVFKNYSEFENERTGLDMSKVFAILLDDDMGGANLSGEQVYLRLTTDPEYAELNLGEKILGTSGNQDKQARYLPLILGKNRINDFILDPTRVMEEIKARRINELSLPAR